MIEGYQVRIVDNIPFMTYDIYVFRRLPNGDIEITREENGTMVTEILPSGIAKDTLKPSLRLNRDLMESLATEMAKISIKPKQTSHVEGKLEGTERHLEDLRKLLKLT